MIFDKKNLWKLLLLIIFLMAGVTVSFWSGDRLEEDVREKWLKTGKNNSAHLTDMILTTFSEAKFTLRALANHLTSHSVLKQADFDALFYEASNLNRSIEFSSVAYAEWIPRHQRQAYEEDNGKIITVVGRSGKKIQDFFESFVVKHISGKTDFLRLNSDLSTHPEMRSAVGMAFRIPEQVILGPAFDGKGKDKYSLIAVRTNFKEHSGVLVATINLTEYFAGLAATQFPDGLGLRLIERDNEARAKNILVPMIGPLTPPENATTEIIRITTGQARWNLNWDIMPDFDGGPVTEFAMTVRVAGSIITILIAAAFGFLVFQNVRISRIVEQRTTDLRKQSKTLQLTLDSMDQGLVFWDSEQRLVAWSRRCLEFWYEPKDIIRVGMPMAELLYYIAEKGAFGPGDLEKIVLEKLNEFKSPELKRNDEFILSNGKIISIYRTPVPSGGHIAMYTDISARKKAEQELEESRYLLQSMADNLPVFVSLKDVDGLYLFANKIFEDWMNTTQDAILGKSLYDFLSIDQAEFLSAADKETLDSGKILSREVVFTFPDGLTRSVISTRFPIFSSTGEVIGIGMVCYDLTDRKEAEKALMESQAQLKSYIDYAPAEIAFKDTKGRYVLVNREFEIRHGVTLEEIKGKTVTQVHNDKTSDYIADFDLEVLNSRVAVRKESEILRTDGTRHVDMETRFPIMDSDDEIIGIGGISIDVTERMVAEKALKEAHDTLDEKVKERTHELYLAKEEAEYSSRTKSAFLANMSHELRTPLNAVIGFSEMIQSEAMGPLENDAYKSYIDLINHSGQHLLSLITEILEISMIDAGAEVLDEGSVDVAKAIMETSKMVLKRAQEASVDLSAEVPDKLPSMRADRKRIKQILLNLLDNAIKFTDSGGKVSTSVALNSDGGIEFQISDTGIGIAEDDIALVMEPFAQVSDVMQRSEGGTGLGLSLTKSFVELHGGTMKIISEIEQGTTVTVSFPPERTLN